MVPTTILGTKKILVIEDSEALLKDIVEMLSLEGFQTVYANNGQAGLDLLEQHHPDLVICDVRMPLLDGYGVLDQLRSNEDTATTPFIFLTARTMRHEQREGMELGAEDYLTKPFTADELISAVNTQLAKNQNHIKQTERELDRLRRSIILALPHELRTPLNAILGFSEIMMTDTRNLSEKQVADMADHINTAALRLYRLAENYIIYANLELFGTDAAWNEALQNGQTRYAYIVIAQQTEEKARQYARQDDLEMTIVPVNRPLAVDGENLSRIVSEIVDNAFKFSEAGTPVSLTLVEMAEELQIIISDEGVGMSQDQIRSIGAYMQFQRAFQEQQGIGFGLTIAKRLTEIHGGQFNIDSEPRMYTTVTLTLPFVAVEQAEKQRQ